MEFAYPRHLTRQAPHVCGRRLHFPHLTSRQGFALVAVLGLTTLAMILVLALLSVSDTSLKSESLDWEQTRARVTADTAVALALGQSKSATSGQFSDGTPRPWTSQPGAIRTYHMDGSPATLHKLYTAADMQAESTASITNDLPGNWQDYPDQFADLNAPLSGSVWPVSVSHRRSTGEDGRSSDRRRRLRLHHHTRRCGA